MIHFFTDPVLRGPMLATMLMALSASLVGVIAFVRRRSLVGETLSHATYPGVALALVFAGGTVWAASVVLAVAFLTALLGLFVIGFLVRRLGTTQDAALCFVLSAFFGIGITIASRIQFTHPIAFMQIERYLYGQAATMTDHHIYLYGGLSLVVMFLILLMYKEIQISSFDRSYAQSLGLRLRLVDLTVVVLIALAVIVGIRSVGVVLMSAMLIAPPVAARQFTNKMSYLFLLAAIIGVFSAFFGNVLSMTLGGLPTGPMIVLTATLFAVASLFLAPERGLILRIIRMGRFRYRCLQENLLKTIWRTEGRANLTMIRKRQAFSKLYLQFILSRLQAQGWLEKEGSDYVLTADGDRRAKHLVRLHRLWEVYLVDYLGVGVERVHRSAEEVEHIITPQLEDELNHLLNDPKWDPHEQPIP